MKNPFRKGALSWAVNIFIAGATMFSADYLWQPGDLSLTRNVLTSLAIAMLVKSTLEFHDSNKREDQ